MHRKGLSHVAAADSVSDSLQVLHIPGGARLRREVSADVDVVDCEWIACQGSQTEFGLIGSWSNTA